MTDWRLSRRTLVKGGGWVAASVLTGCRSSQSPGAQPQQARDSRKKTVVFINATVLPVDSSFSQHEAMAVRGNEVLLVGRTQEVMKVAGRDADVVDVQGHCILPGFIEPHMHFALLAGLGFFPDIGPFKKPTFDEAIDALKELGRLANAEGPEKWIVGRQFDPILLQPERDLTTKDLDPVSKDRPIFVLNASGHIAYVNSKLLEMAGIDKEAEAPPGSRYGRYADGTPNGILYGTGAHMPVALMNEEIKQRLESGFVEAGIQVGEDAARFGITTLCDMATGAVAGPNEVELYRAMHAGGKMKARIRAYLYGYDEAVWEGSTVKFRDGDDRVQIAGLKFVTDGSNQGFTGRQREPYYQRKDRGMFYIEPERLKELVVEYSRAGWPIAMHGNGDAAIDAIIAATEAASQDGVDVSALRHRIEHCSILHDEQIERMKTLHMGPSFLINHVHYWGHVMRDRVFGPKKVELLDRCKAVEEAGLPWVVHTDAPVSPLGTLHKIRVAVARDLWKEPDTVLAPQERVSVESAIRAVTSNAAYLCHSEQRIGSLEPGKLADFVVLREDPRKVDPQQISDISVEQTWMDGRRVFSKG
jgi:hypothetical protein